MTTAIDPEKVFRKLENERDSGNLSNIVTTANPVYEASKSTPGLIDQVWRDGTRVTGGFHGGKFHPITIR